MESLYDKYINDFVVNKFNTILNIDSFVEYKNIIYDGPGSSNHKAIINTFNKNAEIIERHNIAMSRRYVASFDKLDSVLNEELVKGRYFVNNNGKIYDIVKHQEIKEVGNNRDYAMVLLMTKNKKLKQFSIRRIMAFKYFKDFKKEPDKYLIKMRDIHGSYAVNNLYLEIKRKKDREWKI